MTRPAMLQTIWAALGGDTGECDRVTLSGDGALPSVLAVTGLAAASLAAVGLALDGLRTQGGQRPQEPLRVDRRLASIWYASSLRPIGWQVPNPWDAIAGDYRASDGWIRLHTNAPHHRLAAERILGTHPDKAGMARAVAQWNTQALQEAIVQAGGCAAGMHSAAQWAQHPQGRAVASEPLLHMHRQPLPGMLVRPLDRAIDPARPLAGIKVLDLTRVLAGPVASRCLAAYGAQVLRIDPPHWHEPGLVPEVTLGKRLARLDLREPAALARVKALIASADVLLHGYRPGALEGLGLGEQARQQLNPALVDVSLNAYGWTGPWRERRGFDSLVQMSCGIADAGRRAALADAPVPMPVQALDQATGYLMAAAAITGIAERLHADTVLQARLSLARTARLLLDQGHQAAQPGLAAETAADRSAVIEATAWGPAQRIHWPLQMEGCPAHWPLPARALGSDPARW